MCQNESERIKFLYECNVVRERAQSWSRKAESYQNESMEGMMDSFIASYIAYDAWTSLFKDENGRKRCVNKDVKGVLKENQDLVTKLDVPARQLANGITATCFDVSTIRRKDPQLSKNWGKSDGLSTLLKALYNMRCNIFHGQRALRHMPEVILGPAIACMKILNEALAQFFERECDKCWEELRK